LRKKKYAFKSAKRSNGNSKKDLERFNTQIINLHKQNKTQEALALTQQALKSFPNDLILLKNTGAFAGRIGNVSLLEEYMLKILEINSSDVVHYNLGFLFKEKNNLTRQRNTI
jgi:tetratricopeptide (TPR) repeat protein